MIIQHLKGIKKVILPVFENDFWRIRLEVFKNNLEVWQTISTLRKIVQENDDLIIYHRPTPFSFNKEDKDFEVIIENTSKLIRPKEVIDKIINDIEEISIDEEFSAEHIAIEGQFLFTWDEIEIF